MSERKGANCVCRACVYVCVSRNSRLVYDAARLYRRDCPPRSYRGLAVAVERDGALVTGRETARRHAKCTFGTA